MPLSASRYDTTNPETPAVRTMKTPVAFSIFFGFLFLLTGCDSTDAEPEPVLLDVKMAENIPADPASGRDPRLGGLDQQQPLHALRP